MRLIPAVYQAIKLPAGMPQAFTLLVLPQIIQISDITDHVGYAYLCGHNYVGCVD